MNAIFPELPHTLGVYSLTRLIELRENTALYEAQQTHVDRSVVLEVLQPGVPHAEQVAFLAQARHRVATNGIPHIADVFESLRADGIWFLTQEMPQGRSLADIASAGEKLSVQLICNVVSAAAEMYQQCNEKGLNAMPLLASSIFVEDNGEVHFISPLRDGAMTKEPDQMKATAAALWPICPEKKEPGLGRVMTLLKWLQVGSEGKFMEWGELKETANNLIIQLKEEPTEGTNSLTRAAERICRTPQVQQFRQFIRRWGTQVGAGVTIIVGLTCLGGVAGMGEPETIEAIGQSRIMCSTNGQNEQIMRYPVSVQEYAEFMQRFEEWDEEQRQELLDTVPEQHADLTPKNWNVQWERGDRESAVTGVSYFQAQLYARFKGGQIPTANQLQTLKSVRADLASQEWSRSEMESPITAAYPGTIYLLVDEQGVPCPVSSRDWSSPNCGFRVSFPDNQD